MGNDILSKRTLTGGRLAGVMRATQVHTSEGRSLAGGAGDGGEWGGGEGCAGPPATLTRSIPPVLVKKLFVP